MLSMGGRCWTRKAPWMARLSLCRRRISTTCTTSWPTTPTYRQVCLPSCRFAHGNGPWGGGPHKSWVQASYHDTQGTDIRTLRDRKSVVKGKSGAGRVAHGGG